MLTSTGGVLRRKLSPDMCLTPPQNALRIPSKPFFLRERERERERKEKTRQYIEKEERSEGKIPPVNVK